MTHPDFSTTLMNLPSKLLHYVLVSRITHGYDLNILTVMGWSVITKTCFRHPEIKVWFYKQ